jgi:two-component system osmolarity sensor histidine kinase EnvZ
MQETLWPSGLIGRVIAVILGAILLEFAGSVILHSQVDRFTLREDHARRVAELLVVGERLMSQATPDEKREVVATLSTRHLRTELASTPGIPASTGNSTLKWIAERIVAWEPSLSGRDLRLGLDGRSRKEQALVGALQLRDGQWLQFRSGDVLGRWPQLYQTFGTVLILTTGVLAASGLLVHTLGTPLRSLAQAADKVGHGAPVTVLEQGPRDLMQVARAFNAMQARISRLIADRSHALAAVGHDLRTPLTRMRLRLDLLPTGEARQGMTADLDEMEIMLDSVLAYLSGGEAEGPPRMVDLAALISTLVDSSADLGRSVTFEGPDRLPSLVRPMALKRAVSNLIENGLKYGHAVQVRLESVDGMARIQVTDRGPGIPEDELEHVLTPFFRLDSARRRDTGGLGLGLPIVANAVEREDGVLSLRNRPEGGLEAVITLPIRTAQTEK